MWQQWVNGILGIWLVILPFLGFAADTLNTILIITGVVIAVLGFWGATEHAA